MTSGRHQGSAQGEVSLFPFLAVLICILGTLVVLLVVVVQQARSRALSQSANAPPGESHPSPQPPAPVAQLQEEREHYLWQTELLQETYRKTVAQMAERRLLLSHLEDHQRELAKEIRMLKSEAAAIEQARDDQLGHQDASEETLADLQRQIEEAREQLELAKRQRAEQTRTYALIPYDGPNGTQRPPIYIECLEDRVVLQPEGIDLEAEDFVEPLGPDNPLAMALRAKREFLLTRGLASADHEPYPLLVVRPLGTTSYAAARVAMKSWEAEFGYELIEDDVQLDYPPSDAHLVEVVEQAVKQARLRRSLARQVAADRQVGREISLAASPRGGFVAAGERNTREPPQRDLRHSAPTSRTPRPSRARASDAGDSPQPSDDEARSLEARSLAGGKPADSDQAPAVNVHPGEGSSPVANSLADARGRDWALKDKTADAVGITRPLRVVCDPESLVLLPERGTDQKPLLLVHHGRVQDKIDALVDAVRRRIESWGIAGQNAYWKPTLQVAIREGAVGTYAQLTTLLRDSGIEIVRKL
jgi:hypothetical protein